MIQIRRQWIFLIAALTANPRHHHFTRQLICVRNITGTPAMFNSRPCDRTQEEEKKYTNVLCF